VNLHIVAIDYQKNTGKEIGEAYSRGILDSVGITEKSAVLHSFSIRHSAWTVICENEQLTLLKLIGARIIK
jgi:hypothetical protein